MQIADNLALVAELAIGLAGFASLVAVVGQRRGRDSAEVDGLRLRSMLEFSLFVVAFALLPHLPYQAGVAEVAVWRFCNGFFAASAAGLTIWKVVTVSRFRVPGQSLFVLWHGFWLTISFSAVSFLVAGSLEIVSSTAAYLWGLYAYLAIAALVFVRLVRSLSSQSG